MARDLEQRFKESERLFKQGRAQVAVRELRQLAEESGGEPLILNRVGDVLARHGHRAEAIVFFDRIATDLAAAGFYPKAVAVLKKTLRISPDHLPAVLLLGEVYARQDIMGDARAHLLRAGERFLKAKQLAGTKAVYEKLAEIDPTDPLHRVRVAESKALAGDPAGATTDLLGAGALLLRAGRAQEAEKTYRRAAEVDPTRAETAAGIARCLLAQERGDEAVALLEQAASRPAGRQALMGELCSIYERVGRRELVTSLLAGEAADSLPESTFEEIVRFHAERGQPDEGWQRIAPALDRWSRAGRFDRLVPVLEKVSEVEGQDIAALERLSELQRAAGRTDGLPATLERLVRAYWSRSAHGLASTALEELKRIAPDSPLVTESLARRSVSAVPSAPHAAPPAARPAPEAVLAGGRAAVALTVPESNTDREFVSSRLTEAEAFQKYNLLDSAEQQLREVTRRFPGFVEGQGRLASLLRARKDAKGLQTTLVDLALARAAVGDLAGAHEAAKSASADRPLPDFLKAALSGAGVAPDGVPRTAGTPAPADETDDEPEIEIEFGDDESPMEAPEGFLTAPSGEREGRMPPSDALEEVAFFLEQGMRAEALERIATLRKGGFGGERLDVLDRKAALGGGASPFAASSGAARLDDEDLYEISEVLESELGGSTEPAAAGAQPEASEQSVEDVFSAFKEQVAGEIGSEDYRAHYDLGIAYKEMGLLEDAAREFETALASPVLHRDACSMLGLCLRDQGEIAEAARWYREALNASDPGSPEMSGLRYALADALAELGDEHSALDLFASILAADPGYRDVSDRVMRLRQRIGS